MPDNKAFFWTSKHVYDTPNIIYIIKVLYTRENVGYNLKTESKAVKHRKLKTVGVSIFQSLKAEVYCVDHGRIWGLVPHKPPVSAFQVVNTGMH